MPMEQDYADELKSPIADMKNTGSRWGGAGRGRAQGGMAMSLHVRHRGHEQHGEQVG